MATCHVNNVQMPLRKRKILGSALTQSGWLPIPDSAKLLREPTPARISVIDVPLVFLGLVALVIAVPRTSDLPSIRFLFSQHVPLPLSPHVRASGVSLLKSLPQYCVRTSNPHCSKSSLLSCFHTTCKSVPGFCANNFIPELTHSLFHCLFKL